MDTFATASVLLAVIAWDAIVSQLFTESHGDRMATSPSGVPGATTLIGSRRRARKN